MRTGSLYLMEIYIGTPPVKQLVVADTGSEVTWTQCLPCVNCYQQKKIMFNSQKSSSYKVLPCNSDTCKDLGNMRVCNELSELKCRYNVSYADGTNSLGELALETYRLGRISIPNVVYGCGNDNRMSTKEITSGMSGVFGLGRGPLSFLGKLPIYLGSKFSYCLVSHSKRNVRSKLNFGTNAVVSGRGVVSTPLVTKPSSPLYYLTLKAITVNNMRILFTRETRSMKEGGVDIIGKGNILIDSGTPETYLPTTVYQKLKDALESVIQADSIPVPKHPWMLCYKYNKNLRIPSITFHFDGGANLTFPSTSTFTRLEDYLLMTMIPSNRPYLETFYK
ncbi:aspartic proteinase CDR1-like [Impatiens glandulifera]|uniref:aspartic proteinase CDR1-like n=1 Tax=Impatiens glandulifera TaxID=253017 RepID=UPI001FB0723B|nr:aspartic proteinase CDR1-like [Impatiens glandulifera]